MATISIKLAVGTLESLRGNADALQALLAALQQILKQEVRAQLSGGDCYFIGEGRNYRYVVLGSAGLQFAGGSFTAEERAAVEAFCNSLPAALAEQALVTALATQLTLLDDQPVFDERGVQTGRALVVRV